MLFGNRLVSCVVVAACAAACADAEPFVSGSSGGSDGGGGVGGVSEEGGGGQGGSGGDSTVEVLPEGAEPVARVAENVGSLLCHAGRVFWSQTQSRSVYRFDDDGPVEMLRVGGDGPISLRDAGASIMVSVAGQRGMVSLHSATTGEEEDKVAVADLAASAFGNGSMFWATGSRIVGSNGAQVASPVGVVDIAIDAEGPVWIGSDGRVYRSVNSSVLPIGPSVEGARPGTLVLYGAAAAWGTDSGLKLLLFGNGGLFSYGTNAAATAKADGKVVYCDSVPGPSSLYVLSADAAPQLLAASTTCVRVAACGGYAYWATEQNTIARIAIETE